MSCFRLLWSLTILVSLLFVPGLAQSDPVQQRSDAQHTDIQSVDGSVEVSPVLQHDMQKARQKKRAEQMQRDSQKLLELATELKKYVDKAGENILSIEVIRKAEEMEKLARQVKNNMRGE